MSLFRFVLSGAHVALILGLAGSPFLAAAQSQEPDNPTDDTQDASEAPARAGPAPNAPAPAVPAASAASPASAVASAPSTTTITTTTTTVVQPAVTRTSEPGALALPRPPALSMPAAPSAAPPPARPAVVPTPAVASPPVGVQAAPVFSGGPQTPAAVAGGAQLVRDARDAWQHRDHARLAALRDQAIAWRLPLAPWVDYWELAARLNEAGVDEVQAFYARWPGTYVEDRLRDDWLLELGRRRDWADFARDFPRFRMNDDREVTCYELFIEHAAGHEVRDAARAAWLAQRDADDGCQLLAQTLLDDRAFTEDDVWRRLRQAAELGRARAARTAAAMLGPAMAKEVAALWDNPARFLTQRGGLDTARRTRLVALALARMAASDAGAAALQMSERWDAVLDRRLAAWTWAIISKQAAQSLLPDAVDWADRAWTAVGRGTTDPVDWGDDVLDWQARAALRQATGPETARRWRDATRAMDAMSAADRAQPTWAYWHARADLALARQTPEGEADRAQARAALARLAGTLDFYGLLAAEDLGAAAPLPPRPVPPTAAERAQTRGLGGLQRARMLADLDLRDEGRREWNFTLRGMDDRQLLAAAQLACDAADWQLCINTSERTLSEIDVRQRYPMPYRKEIDAAARANGVESTFVLGLVRQETRFMAQLRSHVGASGLMQLMPATAKWTARKTGQPLPDDLSDPQQNLRLGTAYLRVVMDAFGDSQPMAAAAYNAGPGRPRRWRGSTMVDPAVWTENVPFLETRDYVKKVMTNAAIYAALESGRAPELRARLGPRIGPRDAEQPAADIP